MTMMTPSKNCGVGYPFLVVLEIPQQDCGRVCLFSIFAPMEQKLLDLE
jgi:hypothetical protein